MPDPDPTPTPTPDPAADMVALQAKIDQLEKQVADYKLLLADQQTSVRRLRDDADRERKYAAEPFVKDLLGAVDNLDLAVQAALSKGDDPPLAKGVAATISLIHGVLERHGVKRVEVGPGSAFDPDRHTAVMQTPTNDFAPGLVVLVTKPGFVFHDRLIRPAAVVVAAEPPAGAE
jgi:molecular chaperone GrpE